MAGDQQYLGNGTYGGYFTVNRLNKQLHYALQPLTKFVQFCDLHPGWGKGVGETLSFRKISRINTAGGTLIETNVIPSHAFTIATDSVTLSEYGNSVPWTGKLEALSMFDLNDPMMRVLRDDAAAILDKAAGLQFKQAIRKYTATSTVAGTLESRATTSTLASGKNVKGGWRLFHIAEVRKELKARNIPPYDKDGNYICIASPYFLNEIMKDSNWKDDVHYGDPERAFAGEVGRCRGVRFVEETNYLINTIGSGGNYGEAVMFGKEAVVQGVAVPLELRQKIPTDYGRSKGLAWYTIQGFKKFWNATDTNQDGHIIQLTGKG